VPLRCPQLHGLDERPHAHRPQEARRDVQYPLQGLTTKPDASDGVSTAADGVLGGVRCRLENPLVCGLSGHTRDQLSDLGEYLLEHRHLEYARLLTVADGARPVGVVLEQLCLHVSVNAFELVIGKESDPRPLQPHFDVVGVDPNRETVAGHHFELVRVREEIL